MCGKLIPPVQSSQQVIKKTETIARNTPINFVLLSFSLKNKIPLAVTITSLRTSHSKFITTIDSYFNAAEKNHGCKAYIAVGINIAVVGNHPRLIAFRSPSMRVSMDAMYTPYVRGTMDTICPY
jgi:hypothetical protein